MKATRSWRKPRPTRRRLIKNLHPNQARHPLNFQPLQGISGATRRFAPPTVQLLLLGSISLASRYRGRKSTSCGACLTPDQTAMMRRGDEDMEHGWWRITVSGVRFAYAGEADWPYELPQLFDGDKT